MMDELQRLDMRLTTVERQMEEGSKRFERLEKSHDYNTRITLETRQGVDDLNKAVNEWGEKIAAPLEVYDAARTGLRMIGKLGEFCMWMGRKWWLILAVGVAFKVWWSGGSWAEIGAAMSRMLSIGPGH